MNGQNNITLKIVFYVASVAFVLLVGIRCFPIECPDLGFWGALYYSIRLFILEHDLPRFPQSSALVFIYFFAPLIAVSAVWSTVAYFIRSTPSLRLKWKADHVIVCGIAQMGKIIASTLKKNGVAVVGVDYGCPEDFEQWRAETKIPMIFGDFMSRPTLEKAGAARARAIIFASGDDLSNLEAVVSAYDWMRSETGPIRLLWAHVASDKLANTARAALRTKGVLGIRIFDTYDIASRKTIAKYFNPDIRKGITEIDILGFGKFGQDLLEVLVTDAKPEENWIIYVVDIEDRENEVVSISEELGVRDKVKFHRADIRDLNLKNKRNRAFFLCTDDDIGNLAVALMLTGRMHASHIYVRMAKWPIPAIEEHLQGRGGITFININDLVEKGLTDLPGLFEPAQAADLKRHGR